MGSVFNSWKYQRNLTFSFVLLGIVFAQAAKVDLVPSVAQVLKKDLEFIEKTVSGKKVQAISIPGYNIGSRIHIEIDPQELLGLQALRNKLTEHHLVRISYIRKDGESNSLIRRGTDYINTNGLNATIQLFCLPTRAQVQNQGGASERTVYIPMSMESPFPCDEKGNPVITKANDEKGSSSQPWNQRVLDPEGNKLDRYCFSKGDSNQNGLKFKNSDSPRSGWTIHRGWGEPNLVLSNSSAQKLNDYLHRAQTADEVCLYMKSTALYTFIDGSWQVVSGQGLTYDLIAIQEDIEMIHHRLFWAFVPQEMRSNSDIVSTLVGIEKATLAYVKQDKESGLLRKFKSYFQSNSIIAKEIPRGQSMLIQNFSDYGDQELMSTLSFMIKYPVEDLKKEGDKKNQLFAARAVAKSIKSLYQSFVFGTDLTYELSKTTPPVSQVTARDVDLQNILGQRKNEFKKAVTQLVVQNESASSSKILKMKDNRDVDYVIVGSGPAGSYLAHELQKKGYAVVLVDKGPFWIPGAFESRMVGAFREGQGQLPTIDGSMTTLWGQTLGGGGSVNGDVVIEPSNSMIAPSFKEWSKLWSAAELIKSEAKMRNVMATREVKDSEYCYEDRGLGRSFDTNNCLLKKGAVGLGLEVHNYKRNDVDWRQSVGLSSKKDYVDMFIKPAMFPAEGIPLTVLTEAEVSRVLFKAQSRQAEGIEFEIRNAWPKADSVAKLGLIRPNELYPNLQLPELSQVGSVPSTKFKLYAKNVILAAGALGSPIILSRSGIQNPNVGGNLVIHPVTYVTGVYDSFVNVNMHKADGSQSLAHVESWSMNSGANNTNGVELSKRLPNFLILTGQFLPSGVAATLPGSPSQLYSWARQYSHTNTLLLGVIDRPNINNRVYYGSNRSVNIQYSIGRDEAVELAKAVKTASRILLTSGAKEVYLHTSENLMLPDEKSKQDPKYSALKQDGVVVTNQNISQIDFSKLQFRSNQSFLAGFHGQSTCRMGLDRKDSVVNTNYQVWDTQNLYVVDASVFPASVGSHPMQSILTISDIFLERVVYSK